MADPTGWNSTLTALYSVECPTCGRTGSLRGRSSAELIAKGTKWRQRAYCSKCGTTMTYIVTWTNEPSVVMVPHWYGKVPKQLPQTFIFELV